MFRRVQKTAIAVDASTGTPGHVKLVKTTDYTTAADGSEAEIALIHEGSNGNQRVYKLTKGDTEQVTCKKSSAGVSKVITVGSDGSSGGALPVVAEGEYFLRIEVTTIDAINPYWKTFHYVAPVGSTEESIADGIVALFNSDEALSTYVVAAKITFGGTFGVSFTGTAPRYNFDIGFGEAYIGAPVADNGGTYQSPYGADWQTQKIEEWGLGYLGYLGERTTFSGDFGDIGEVGSGSGKPERFVQAGVLYDLLFISEANHVKNQGPMYNDKNPQGVIIALPAGTVQIAGGGVYDVEFVDILDVFYATGGKIRAEFDQ